MTEAERAALVAEIAGQAPPLSEDQRRAVRRLAPRPTAEPEHTARRPRQAA